MAVRTTYNDRLPVAFAGMIADIEAATIISRTVETAAIGYGLAAKRGSADHKVAAATANSDTFMGITCREQSGDADTANQIKVGETAPLLVTGTIWVTAGATVVEGEAAYMIAADGRFTSSSSGNLAIPNAKFDKSADADDLVPIRIT